MKKWTLVLPVFLLLSFNSQTDGQPFLVLKNPQAGEVVAGRVVPQESDTIRVTRGRVAGMAVGGIVGGGVGVVFGGALGYLFVEQCETWACGIGSVALGAAVGELLGATYAVHIGGAGRHPYPVTLLAGLGGTAFGSAVTVLLGGYEPGMPLIFLPLVFQITSSILVSL